MILQIFGIGCLIHAMVFYQPGSSHSFSYLEPSNISSWPKAIMKSYIADLPGLLKIIQEEDRRLFSTTDVDGPLYKVPVSFQESISGILVVLECSSSSTDTLEKLERNISITVGLLHQNNLSATYTNKSMSVTFAICPFFNTLKEFDRIIRILTDLNQQHLNVVSTVLLNFGALRLGQINAFHIIQYVEIANSYAVAGNFQTGLLFDSRICSELIYDALFVQLREIADTPMFIEEPVLDRKEIAVSEYLDECSYRLGWHPVYYLPGLRLITSERFYILDRMYNTSDGPIIPVYNIVNTTNFNNNDSKACPMDTRFPPMYPVDYIVSLDVNDFLTAVDNENVILQFSNYNASFFDVYRRFTIQFGSYDSAQYTVPLVLSKVLNYSRRNPIEYFQRPLSVWIVFTPSGDLSTQLLDLLEVVVSTQSVLKGLVSHIFLDYGSLRINSYEYSTLKRDVELCNELLESRNLSCGFMVHQRNCAIKETSLEKLPFSRKNILIFKGLSVFCTLSLKNQTKVAFMNGMITVNFISQTSATIRESPVDAFDPRNTCPFIGADRSIWSVSIMGTTSSATLVPSIDPFSKDWLQRNFKFTSGIGFTMSTATSKLYASISQIIVLTNTNASDFESNPGTKGFEFVEHYLQYNSFGCQKRMIVTYAIDWNITDQFSRLDELFDALQNAQVVTPSVCYAVLMDWAPLNIDDDTDTEILVQKLSFRFLAFMVLLDHAQKKSDWSGIYIDIYIDAWFIKTHKLVVRDPPSYFIWNNAFRKFRFLVFRVETSFQTLLTQRAYNTAKSVIAEMEDSFTSTQYMLFSLASTATQPEQIDRIIFQLAVFGCPAQLSLPEAIEFAKFIDIINNWAIFANGTIVIASSAINENRNTCSQPSHPLLSPKYCPCGWWIQTMANKSLKTMKAYAMDLYNLKHTKETSQEHTTSSVGILVTGVAFMLLFAVFVIVGAYSWRKHSELYVLTKNQKTGLLHGHQLSLRQGGPSILTYDAKKLEIARKDISYGENSNIGKGESGTTVAIGTVPIASSRRQVALKLFKLGRGKVLGNSNFGAIKALINEAKILDFLGEHRNIIKLFGACTSNMRKGEVILALEYCSFGSLDKMLRQNNHADNHRGELLFTKNLNEDEGVSELDLDTLLSKWTLEIAEGMEFLVSKMVVHNDLATRNILIDSSKTVKIADFGLSRLMQSDCLYMKEGSEPLPWRWMAPESLQRSIFNEKTDVWAFAITLWEMYTFGEIPYGGNSWNPSFILMVQNGLRPEIPEDVPPVEARLIKRCWNLEPSKRPTFTQCKAALQLPETSL